MIADMSATTTRRTGFRVDAIPAAELDRIRANGLDDFGNPLTPRVVRHSGGTPPRCCLREADAGERVVLIAYRPSDVGGPYAEVGPVFVHERRCDGYAAAGRYPEGFRHRQQLLRAYDERGRQVENVIVDGVRAEFAIDDLLGRQDVAFVHSRNVLAGCYMFAITRDRS
jgi:Protein of unknown function (DUF1203)